MSSHSNNYTDHLFLLVGTNPLPNYAAVLFLLPDFAKARLLFIYSSYTDQQRLNLEAVLKERGFAEEQFVRILVEEASPDAIYNKVSKHAQAAQGQIRLNYTGGTKAMAVHAYRTLEGLFQEHKLAAVQFSYLDARFLIMQITQLPEGQVGRIVSLAYEVSLREVLRLHSRESSMKSAPLWPRTAQAITELHQEPTGREAWKQWVVQTFLSEPAWPAPIETEPEARDEAWKAWVRQQILWTSNTQRRWKANSEVEFVVPEKLANIFDTLRTEAAIEGALSVAALKGQRGFKNKGDCGKWFEGEWLDSYVLDQVLALKDRPGNPYHIGDTACDIQATGPQDVQIDVAFMRGYQLFAIACTTDKSLAKSKLLEAVVRAEQLGGAEARVALVCSADTSTSLKAEVEDLLAKKVAVFGAAQLPQLQNELSDWIDGVS